MKKVLVAVVLMMGIGSFSAFAAEISVDSVVIACEVNQDDFVKVEVKDLPGVVTQSIEKSYPDSVIQEVYVAEKTEGKLFKVIFFGTPEILVVFTVPFWMVTFTVFTAPPARVTVSFVFPVFF